MNYNRDHHQAATRFAVSIHPEIFYALQVLSEDASRIHPGWRAMARKRFPRREWPLDLPGRIWPAVADALEIEPTIEFPTVTKALLDLPPGLLQERLLFGLLHHESAVGALLAGDVGLVEIASKLPRKKREWLAHIGLYPLDPQSPAAVRLAMLIDSPERFQADLVETLERFWETVFADTWDELQPALVASVVRRQKQYETCAFPEFIRHTLLPIEFDTKRRVLRALRGGYELPWRDVNLCTFTPSAFNNGRLWTVYSGDTSPSPWFPYFEPDLMLRSGSSEHDRNAPAPDIALIFRALGDTTRFALVSLVGRQPRTAIELAKMLSVSKPTISHHIHLLRAAGLIHETVHGGSVLISLKRVVFEQLAELAVARIFESRWPLDLRRSRK